MPTKLDRWMKENRYSDRLFAEKLATVGVRVSARTVESWRQGRAMPRKKALGGIKTVTNDEVLPNDWIEAA